MPAMIRGTPIEPRTLTRTYHALCERHGLRRVRLHDLRHGCVSLLLALGVSPRVVMEIVGHSAIEMTMNVYANVSLDNQRAALDLLNAQLVEDDDGDRVTSVAVTDRCQRGGKISDTWSDLVGVTGFEPAAPRSQSECATKLRYTPCR